MEPSDGEKKEKKEEENEEGGGERMRITEGSK